MKWFDRFWITWSAAAIAFSVGCVVRGQVGGQAETAIHLGCVGFHAIVISVYVGLFLSTLAQREQGKGEER